VIFEKGRGPLGIKDPSFGYLNCDSFACSDGGIYEKKLKLSYL